MSNQRVDYGPVILHRLFRVFALYAGQWVVHDRQTIFFSLYDVCMNICHSADLMLQLLWFIRAIFKLEARIRTYEKFQKHEHE